MHAPIQEERTWSEVRRARRTIVVADVVESVRLMREHEDDVIDRWRRLVNDVRADVLPKHAGRLVKSLGDGMLLEFEQTPRALAAAFEVQRHVVGLNRALAEDRFIRLRIGLHVAEVVTDELDVYGAGVNLAARLAGVARPGGVAASVEAVDELLPGVDALLEDAGLCYLKHLDEPVQVYHLEPSAGGELQTGAALQVNRLMVKPLVGDTALATCVALVPIASTEGDAEQGTLPNSWATSY